MGRELILADASGTPRASVLDYDLDMGFGSDENRFELTLHEGPEPSSGWYWWCDGTEYGGVIDSMEAETDTGLVTWSGRTWHGILAAKVLAPDAGRDYLTASGSATDALAMVVSRTGLGSLFAARAPATGSGALVGTYQFDRYVGAYDGVRKMLRGSGLKLSMSREGDRVALSAEPVVTYGNDVDSDRIEFKIDRDWRPVNHLVCLGSGELKDRVVVDLYADASGRVSQTQTLFGVDERADTYDYSNAERDELVEKGTEKLSDMQSQGSIDVTVSDGAEYMVGDVLVGRWAKTGETVTAEVTKKVVKAELGELSVSYECGAASSANSTLSGSYEGGGSGGGHAYYAGDGLKLVGYTFSADVTQGELDEAVSRAEAAERSASDAAAAVGGKVDAVVAPAPLSAAKSGSTVTLGISAASGTSAGTMSAADKAKLDGIDPGANAYELPVATTATLGGVMPDGTTTTVGADGRLHASVSASAASFLTAHPVGCIYLSESGDPSAYGGSWERRPSLGAFAWARVG